GTDLLLETVIHTRRCQVSGARQVCRIISVLLTPKLNGKKLRRCHPEPYSAVRLPIMCTNSTDRSNAESKRLTRRVTAERNEDLLLFAFTKRQQMLRCAQHDT